MLAFALSLASSFSWGLADFYGGLLSRRIHVLAVLLISQSVGLVLAIAIVPLWDEGGLSASHCLLAAGAGAAGVAALGAFYRALAIGTMSVVAPIAAMGVAVPVAVGLFGGEQPAVVQLIGVALAVTAVVLIGREESIEEDSGSNRQSIALAVLAALGFGTFLTLVDFTAERDAAWTLAAVRIGGVSSLLIAVAALRPPLAVDRSAAPILIGIGALDVLANGLYAVATTKGLLSLVAVGGSLYPAVTILLAHRILGERLAPVQRIGVAMALGGVVLIAAGT